MSFDANKTGCFEAVKRSPWPETRDTDAPEAYPSHFQPILVIMAVFAGTVILVAFVGYLCGL